MASVSYQGLQSCLEPLQIEPTVLTTKLHHKPKPEPNPNNRWINFFNVLDNPSSKNESEVYVHPMVKRSASALSTVSLEMCTESLGTETGSDVSESSDHEFNCEERERFNGFQRSKLSLDRRMVSHRRGGGGFPPPLTSISGSDGKVKVSPYREGGRLVIKAVSVSDCGIKFEAKRTNGRLSLSLWRTCCVNDESGRGKVENEGGDAAEEGGGGWWESDGKTEVWSPEWKESTEVGLTKCKDGGSGNKGIGNWSLFRVVIS